MIAEYPWLQQDEDGLKKAKLPEMHNLDRYEREWGASILDLLIDERTGKPFANPADSSVGLAPLLLCAAGVAVLAGTKRAKVRAHGLQRARQIA